MNKSIKNFLLFICIHYYLYPLLDQISKKQREIAKELQKILNLLYREFSIEIGKIKRLRDNQLQNIL